MLCSRFETSENALRRGLRGVHRRLHDRRVCTGSYRGRIDARDSTAQERINGCARYATELTFGVHSGEDEVFKNSIDSIYIQNPDKK